MSRLTTVLALGLFACGTEFPDRTIGALEGRCSSCHPEQQEGLDASLHGRAARSEVFLALRQVAIERFGEPPLCDRCHRPEHGTDVGLSCLNCHAAVGNFGTENGKLALELDGPVRGVRAQIDPRAPHEVAVSGFLSSPDLCGTCHEVDGPGPFDERPFSHWLDSPAAEAGIGCKECHLGPRPGTAEEPWPAGPVANLPQLPERPLADHHMRGLGGDSEIARALLDRSSRLEITQSDPNQLVVEIENLGLGHRLPDGASFVREVWVSLELYRSNKLLEASEVWLSARGRRDGREVSSPLDADEIQDNGIPPSATLTKRWSPSSPASGDRLRACLRFRRYRPDLLESLGLPTSLAGPLIEVKCVESTLGP